MNIPRTCTRSLAPGVLALLGVALLLAPLPPDGTAVAAAAAAHAQPPGVSRAAPSSVAPAAAAPAAATTPAAAAASAPAAGTASPDAAGTPGASPAPATAAGISDNDDDDRDDRDEVNIGGDSVLSRGENADEVVAVFGSATSEGTVSQDVVAVFGDARMTGTAGGSVVAVLGDVYVDGEVDQDVVSVLGHIELGPHARINGQVVNVFGSLHRDPAAVISGGVHRVFPGILHDGFAPGLRAWLHEGVLFGRPLALGSGLSWAWYTALAFLALYLLVAVLFRDAVDHCVATLSLHPGPAVMTALLAMLITPLAMFLLFATLIGIPAIPILACALFAAGILGKVVALAWLGRRVAGLAHAVPAHPALAVLLGGIVTLAAYLVPLLGFVVFVLLGLLGFGAVLYALLQRARRPRAPGPGTGTQTGASASAASASVQGTQAGTAGLHDAPPGAGAAPHTQDPAAAQGPAAQDPAAQGPAAQGPFAQGPAAEDPAAQGHAQGPVPRAAAPLPPAFLVTLPRAGFWVRMGALLIDLIVVGVSLDLLLGWNDAWSGAGTRSQLVVLAIYGAVMWKTMQGRTIGNMAFDLHVVRQDGRELDWPIVIVRALGCILSAVVVFLGFFWIAIDEDHQAWHDKLAGTVVVRHSRRSAQPQQS